MITNTNTKQYWTGDGVNTTFPFNFQLPNDDLIGADIQLYTLSTAGVLTGPLILNSDYTIYMPSSTITYPKVGKPMAVPLPAGWQLIALRVVPLTQTTAFTNQGNFNPALLGGVFDRMTMMIQGFNEQLSRAWIAPISSTASYQLPVPRASQLLGWDSAGQYLTSYANPGSAVAMNEIQGPDIVAASTTNIGGSTGTFLRVTGSYAGITSLGSAPAGNRRVVLFTGICTLVYNATTLILPGSANYTTAAGDILTFLSLGSGNWVCAGVLDWTVNATNVTTNINGHAIPSILESDGVTAKNATNATGDTRFQISGCVGGQSTITIPSFTSLAIQKITRIVPNGKNVKIKRAGYYLGTNMNEKLNIVVTQQTTSQWTSIDNINEVSGNNIIYTNNSGNSVAITISINIYAASAGGSTCGPGDGWWLDLSIE